MYRNDVIIAVDSAYSNKVEPQIELLGSYLKTHLKKGDFFELVNVEWEPDYIYEHRRLIDILDDLPDGSFAFARIGDELNDVEFRGYPEEFKMKFIRKVKY